MEPELDIFAAIDRAALRKRGTLRAWMAENRAAFEERLLTRKPDWPTLAGVFASAGLLDSRGNPPTAEATRKTWQRVKGPVRIQKVAAKTPSTNPARSTPVREFDQQAALDEEAPIVEPHTRFNFKRPESRIKPKGE